MIGVIGLSISLQVIACTEILLLTQFALVELKKANKLNFACFSFKPSCCQALLRFDDLRQSTLGGQKMSVQNTH